MNDLMTTHKAFFKILEGAETTFKPSPYGQSDALTGTFACNCGRQFSTALGLATHKRQAHKEFSLEHDLLEGTTCPECLRHFWTIQRLYQHLAFASGRTCTNPCSQALRQRGFYAHSEINRCPKKCVGWGELPVPVRGQLDKNRIQADLNALYEDLLIQRQPDDLDGARTQSRSFLAETADDWRPSCHEGYEEELAEQLPDRWLAVLFQFEQGMDGWVEDGGSRDFSKGTALFA